MFKRFPRKSNERKIFKDIQVTDNFWQKIVNFCFSSKNREANEKIEMSVEKLNRKKSINWIYFLNCCVYMSFASWNLFNSFYSDRHIKNRIVLQSASNESDMHNQQKKKNLSQQLTNSMPHNFVPDILSKKVVYIYLTDDKIKFVEWNHFWRYVAWKI